MPLRFLIYYSSIMQDIINTEKYDLYGRKRIMLPTPRFIVFYNGLEQRPEREVMRLSDAFMQKDETYQLELTCDVYNINPGNNGEVKSSSKVLNGYTIFVEKVREYMVTEKEIRKSVRKSIDDCIENHILEEFFRERGREVEEMAALDFTFERREELIRRDSYEEGIEQGVISSIKIAISLGAEEKAAVEIAAKNFKDMDLEQIEKIWRGYKENEG